MLPSFGRASPTVWLHHFDFNETLGEKDRCELFKNATYCFEQTLKAAPPQAAREQPPAAHLTNHPNKIKADMPGTGK